MTTRRSMLVTGGASGLGLAIARAAHDAGYRVASIDPRSPAPAPTSSAPGSNGATAIAQFPVSVGDEADVERVLDEFGPPDVVVNNAGIVRFGPLLGLGVDDFRAVLDVNLIGTFIVSRAAARRWVAAGEPGCIVNISSMNGVAAGPNAGSYGPSKAAVALLTTQMSLEWGGAGIRVNAVAPGLIDAGMSEPIYADEPTREARTSKVPLGRLGTAADIADAVLFLASDKASYITGQNIVVDGGVTGSVIAHLPRPATVDSVGHP